MLFHLTENHSHQDNSMNRVYKDHIYGAKIETIQYLGYFLEEHIYGFRNNFSRCFRKL